MNINTLFELEKKRISNEMLLSSCLYHEGWSGTSRGVEVVVAGEG